VRRSRAGKNFVAFIKSEKAQAFVKSVDRQTPTITPLLGGRLRITVKVFYATERPDLDISLLMDCLQMKIYRNDRQIREQHVYHDIDKADPRVVVKVEEIAELFQTAGE
jgi:Holliday junction resolvase RusA-like endonuclease